MSAWKPGRPERWASYDGGRGCEVFSGSETIQNCKAAYINRPVGGEGRGERQAER